MPETQVVGRLTFRLTLDGGRLGRGLIREVSGLESETEVTEEKAEGELGEELLRKVAGPTRWSNITLRRAVDENLDFWEWREQVIQGGPEKARKDGAIELIDYEGSPVATYHFENAWPVRYDVAVGRADEGGATETVEICVEHVERT